MTPMKTYFVYVMSNESKMIYVGVTNSMRHRVALHKKKLVAGFTQRYNLYSLSTTKRFQTFAERLPEKSN